LAPAFDVNPNPDPEAPRVTAIAGQSGRAESWAAAMDSANQFGLDRERAQQIAAQVLDALGRWRQAAEANGLSRAELDRFAPVLDWRPPTG
jgi:serine/threonine-protein kinase HipA